MFALMFVAIFFVGMQITKKWRTQKSDPDNDESEQTDEWMMLADTKESCVKP